MMRATNYTTQTGDILVLILIYIYSHRTVEEKYVDYTQLQNPKWKTRSGKQCVFGHCTCAVLLRGEQKAANKYFLVHNTIVAAVKWRMWKDGKPTCRTRISDAPQPRG